MEGDELDRLLLQARRGDELAYRRFLARAAARLRPELARKIAWEGEVEQLVRQCLAAMHRKLHTLDPQRPVGPWMRAIARYRLEEHWRGHDGNTLELAEPELDLADAAEEIDEPGAGAGRPPAAPAPAIPAPTGIAPGAMQSARPISVAAVLAGIAIALAAAAALGAGLAPRSGGAIDWGMSAGRWLFAALVLGPALAALEVLGKPGRRGGRIVLAALLPFAVGLLFVSIETAARTQPPFPGAAWQQCLAVMVAGGTGGAAAAIAALRRLAPVRQRTAGAAAGLFGGGLALVAYAPFCPEAGALHLLAFEGLPILALALAGWLAGPRLLRW